MSKLCYFNKMEYCCTAMTTAKATMNQHESVLQT